MTTVDVLGALLLRLPGNDIELTSMPQRLLGLLVAAAGRPVPAEAIVEALWGAAPPRTARKTLHIYVHRLRRLVGEDQLIRSEFGYALLVPGGSDAARFEGLLDSAAAATAGGDLLRADQLLGEALALWRGPAYSGVREVAQVGAEAARLDELRLTAIEKRASVGLELGRHDEMVSLLAAAIAQNPFRERLRGQLMVALYRGGRQAEALEVYRQTRQLLIAEIGVEPGAELQHLHQAMLRNDLELSVPPAAPASGSLPDDLPDFTGRESELAQLDEMHEAPSTLVITATAGAAAIGKTTLAVRWAHRVAHRYPDGQLYLNLRGNGRGRPMRPLDALLHLLRCLDVPRETLPTEVEEAAALYRSLLAKRTMLIVLDNASTTDQVRPLLPGSSRSQVVVTSRDRLSGLIAHEGARRLTLGPLTEAEALQLLRRLMGATRIDAEPQAAAAIVRLCGGLPLALRLAASTPASALTGIADALASDGGGTNITAVLERSYRMLHPQVQHIFRLLGLIPGVDFTAGTAAAIAQVSRLDAAGALDILAAAHLLQPQTPHRYGFHDLVREYAIAVSNNDDRESLRRLLRHMRDMAAAANGFIGAAPIRQPSPSFASTPQAMAWMEAERVNLMAAVTAAAQAGEVELACDIARSMAHYFHTSGHVGDWVGAFETAFAAVEHLGETKAKYFILDSLGNAYGRAGRYSEAMSALQRCVDAGEELDEPVAAASSRHNLAGIYELVGRYEEALVLQETALETFRKYESRSDEAMVLGTGLSNVYRRIGLWDKAIDCLLQALAIARELGEPLGITRTLNNLGTTYLGLGHLGLAQQYLSEALALSRSIGDRDVEPLALAGLSDLHRQLGRIDEAIAMRLQAHAIITATSPRHRAPSHYDLATLYEAAGQIDHALENYEQAAACASQRGERHHHGRALAALGRLTGSPERLLEAIRLLNLVSPLEAHDAQAALAQLSPRLVGAPECHDREDGRRDCPG